jgi:hypothetical protein
MIHSVAAVAWSVVYSYGLVGCFKLALLMILRDFLLVGMVVATIFWLAPRAVLAYTRLNLSRAFSNYVLLAPPTHSTAADSKVEWAYAFDVHTNAFFPLYLTLYLGQLFLVPLLLKNNWVCLWLGNTLYLAAYVATPECCLPLH